MDFKMDTKDEILMEKFVLWGGLVLLVLVLFFRH